jgi:putative RecB family exonuclease
MSTFTPQLRDSFAWDGKRLVAANQDVVEKLRRKNLSASTAQSMDGCVARWAGERMLTTAEDPFGAAPQGSAAHEIFEDMFAMLPLVRTRETAEKLLQAKADKQWPVLPGQPAGVTEAILENRKRWVSEVRHAYAGLFKIEDPRQVRVLSLEFKIDGIEIGGVPAVGYIDRVSEVVTEDGVTGMSIDDYKTGKKIPLPRYNKYPFQIQLYTDAVRTLTGEKPVAAQLLYTKVGEGKPVDISERAIDKTLKKFGDAWDKHNRFMDDGSFPTETGPLCGWCPLVNACHVAKAAGLGPRAEGLPAAADLGIPSLRPGIAPVPVVSTDEMTVSGGREVTFWMPEPDYHGLAEMGRDYNPAAHMKASGENPKELEGQDQGMPKIVEEKPWEVYAGGELNPASYAAISSFGLATMAVEQLNKAGLPVTGKNVKALGSTYHHIVTEAQKSWTGSVSLADAANTRMRGALHTVLATMPQPFGKEAADWDAWVAAAIRRCQSITAVALYLFSEPKPEAPWASIEGTPGATPAVEAPAPVRALAAVPDPEPAPVKAAAPVKKPAADPDFPDDDDLDDSVISEYAS